MVHSLCPINITLETQPKEIKPVDQQIAQMFILLASIFIRCLTVRFGLSDVMFVIGQVKSDSLDLKQPIRA